ncbi:MAG: transcriptional repressor LexA [Gammaproteobacteria bacterium]|nr:transcriptional repressor LexA [Gammaproteobacteria bacterium]
MLTEREQTTLQFIVDFYAKSRKSPLLTEIAEGLGIQSKGVVHRYLSSLEEQGYIRRHQKHRGIELVDHPNYDELPLLGCIAAGKPIEAIENRELINFAHLLGGTNRYVLQVKGHSMIDEGIRSGDLVVIEQAKMARSNQIVVALIDNHEATLKRIKFPNRDTVRLIPANKNMQPKNYSADRVTIQGVLVGQVRMYT